VVRPDGAAEAARRGVNIVSTLGTTALRAVVQSFREAAAGQPLLVGAQRHVLIADTDDEAMKLARPAYQRWYENLTSLWRSFNSVPLRFFDTLEKAVENDVAIVGCNYFVGRFMYGNLPYPVAARSQDLFAREVMPHFAR
jgi:alkanesulfonate monooxygenase SsuD/methylene tetrahydromethanopterin reductase-like flavin-dependent oxidoreductase (luciferase family)